MNDLRQLLSRAVRGETVGPYRIRLVSAEQVRNLSPEGQEFGLGGVHDDLAMIPPNEIWFDFVSGLYRGVRVHSLLLEHAEGTRVEETYHLPWPAWAWLRAWIARSIIRKVDLIWEEDLRVKVCRGGWPGIPRQDDVCEQARC